MTDYWQERKSKQRTSIKQKERQPELSVSPLAEAHEAVRRSASDPYQMTSRNVMALQRTVGNQAVAQMLGLNRSRQEGVGQEMAAHEVTHGGQRLQGVVQRAGDETVPLEDYGDLSIPKWWQMRKHFQSKRGSLPSNRMRPGESRDMVTDRLNVKKSEARERARITNKPAPDELTQNKDDLGELYSHAQMLKHFYDHTLGNYARQTGGEYHSGPIKTLGRAMDKVSTDYTDKDTSQQRPERVKDLLRSSIVYPDARHLARGVRNMKMLAPGVKVRNVKNKFKKGQGYGDVNMSLEVGDGFITELQMHLASFWALKHTKQDHDRYEDISILERAKEKNSRRFGPKKQAKLDQLKQQHGRTYDDAMDREGNDERDILKTIREYSN